MVDFISVILPTYNPDLSNLTQTIAGLKDQTLSLKSWELILIDNNSSPPVEIDLGWHPNAKIITAPKQGLTHARMAGFTHATGDLIVMVDDDNILNNKYLENALSIFESNKMIGVAGGKSIPKFDVTPPVWLKEFYGSLALRDMGEKELTSSWEDKYPSYAPIGAGMVIRREALKAYLLKENKIMDRQGSSLTSGGDNDMVIEISKSGWQVGYFPSLILTHIIPKERMQVKYLAKLVNNTNKSWVELLNGQHINPWSKISKWTVKLRKLKAWFTYKAWSSHVNYIRWQGACGIFDGQAAI